MVEKALTSRWMAAMILMISSTTNSYSLLHHRPPATARSIVGTAASKGTTRRPAGGANDGDIGLNQRRRSLIGSATAASFSLLLPNGLGGGATIANAAAEPDGVGSLEVIKTPSGLKYLDLVPGTGRSPQYGELLSIVYTGYLKLPNNNAKKYPSEPQQFDRVTDGYLVKHGNGKTIAGLDEGLHTMREGGTRRILIPPKLGFVDIGLGPLPESPWDRDKLNRLLDQMIELSGGTLIYEVTLKTIIVDEADQGYYTDETISPEDFAKLRANMQQQAAEARLAKEALDRQPKNADKII